MHDLEAVEEAEAPDAEGTDEAEEEEPPEDHAEHLEPQEDHTEDIGLDVSTTLRLVGVDDDGAGSLKDGEEEDHPGVLSRGMEQSLSFEHLSHFA